MSPDRNGTISFIDGSGDVVDFGYYDVSDITEEENKLRIVVGDTIHTIPLVEPHKTDSGIRVTDGNNTFEIATATTEVIESFEDSNWFDDWEENENSFGQFGRNKDISIDGSYSFYHTGDTGNYGFSMSKHSGYDLIKEGEIVSSYLWAGENSSGIAPNLSFGLGTTSSLSIWGTGIYVLISSYSDSVGIHEYVHGDKKGESGTSLNISTNTWYKISFLYDPGNHKAKIYDVNGNNIATISYNGSSVTNDRPILVKSTGYDSGGAYSYFDYIKREEDFVNY